MRTEGKSSNNLLLHNVNKTDKSNKIISVNKQAGNGIHNGIFATYNKSNIKNMIMNPTNKKKTLINQPNHENQSLSRLKITSDYTTNSKINICNNNYKNNLIKNLEFKTFTNILNKDINKSNEKEYKNTINNAIDNLLYNSNKHE